ncbi:DUF3231 family protein [Paenibacillus sp. tmac-D7]|uniref:DUF3231 family protein n=1 Tax=Paenibacillus sp. tmac-D7 TaxID=2591462 RepID=UPI001144C61C|nr:DUF3231 family protein [Paenibacillus sp. tmac-D7]
MGILDGNPKHEPMHYGEIYALWAFSSQTKLASTGYHTLRNHAGDSDLREFMKELIDVAAKEIDDCDALLIKNGITPPPSPPEKPKANLEDIPAGARFTDQEISASLSVDLMIGLNMCSQIIGQAIREDIGMLFTKYHQTKTGLSSKLLRMNKAKGWLVPPPLQLQTKELVHS